MTGGIAIECNAPDCRMIQNKSSDIVGDRIPDCSVRAPVAAASKKDIPECNLSLYEQSGTGNIWRCVVNSEQYFQNFPELILRIAVIFVFFK
jgi:hypothetical protein